MAYSGGSGSRGATASSIGMMEGAFFVGRVELLRWVNTLLQINLSKVEQCANGAVYCQIIDSCSPGSVSMRRVNWAAKTDHEFIPNYKVLQAAFDRKQIQRNIEVDKLIRAKYQDNLEFLQWMKCHWERSGGPDAEYDPYVAREGKQILAWAAAPAPPNVGAQSMGGATRQASEQVTPRRGSADAGAQRPATAPDNRKRPTQPAAAAVPPGRSAEQRIDRPQHGGGYPVKEPHSAGSRAVPAHEVPRAHERSDVQQSRAASQAQAEQAEELTKTRALLEDMEQERDFYFRKLRNVEIMCTTLQESITPQVTPQNVLEQVLNILGAEDDEDPDADEVRSQIMSK